MSPSPGDQPRALPPRPEGVTLALRSDELPRKGTGPAPPAGVPAELVDHPRYRVLQLLGQGGMGAVYLAEHLVMGRRVALKTINTRFLTSPDAVRRFHREVQAAAKLAAVLLRSVLDSPGGGKGQDSHALAGSPPSQLGATDAAGGERPADKSVSWEGDGPKRVLADPTCALDGVLDFREVTGATHTEFHDWYESLGPGYRLSFLNTRKGGGPVLFNAVAVREKVPLPTRFFPDMTEAEADRTDARMHREGFRYIGGSIYTKSTQVFHSQLWLKDGISKFSFWWGTMDFMTGQAVTWKQNGQRPFLFESHWGGDQGVYKIALGEDEGLKWEVRYKLGPEEVLSSVESGKRGGLRPDVLAPYWDGDRLRFVLMLLENRDRLDWRFRMEMSLQEYEKESAAQKQQGLLPLAVTSYGDRTNVLYAAIWVRYRLPE